MQAATKTKQNKTQDNQSGSAIARQVKPEQLSTVGIQPKLKIGQPNDKYEREADTNEVLIRKISNEDTIQSSESSEERVQRKCSSCEQDTLQRKADTNVPEITPDFSDTLKSTKGKGEPLSMTTRESMGKKLNADFSNVRVHTGTEAQSLTESIQAKAFTHGSDIYFNKGYYDDTTSKGKGFLAHELTHTIQQGASIQRKTEEDQEQSTTSTPTIQRGVLDWVTEKTQSAVSSVGELAEKGLDFSLSILNKIAPGLARLIKVGPLGILKDLILGSVKEWTAGILGNFNLAEKIQVFKEHMVTIFSTIRGIAKGDPKSCKAFSDAMQAVRTWIKDIVQDPSVQMIINSFKFIRDSLGKITNFIIAPVFDSLMKINSIVFSAIKGYAEKIWQWGKKVKAIAGNLWDIVKEKLGIVSDEGNGIWEWIKEKANQVWKSMQPALKPVVKPLKAVLKTIVAVSPAGPIMAVIKYGPQVVEAIQWLWENRNNPDIIKSAHEEMGHTFLPKLLDGLKLLKNGFFGGITKLKEQLGKLVNNFSELMYSINNSIISFAGSIINGIGNGMLSFFEWVQTGINTCIDDLKALYLRFKKTAGPLKDVVTSIGLAVVQPHLIPVILTGWAWRAIPDCYKIPIIDFLLDGMIGFIKVVSAIPFFGSLWRLLKLGMVAALERFRDQKTPEGLDDTKNPKVILSNKIANILSGNSVGFLFGFVKGFLRGVWEGLTDPFKIAYMLVKGLWSFSGWLNSMIFQAPRSIHAIEGAGISPVGNVPGTTGEYTQAGMDDQAIVREEMQNL